MQKAKNILFILGLIGIAAGAGMGVTPVEINRGVEIAIGAGGLISALIGMFFKKS